MTSPTPSEPRTGHQLYHGAPFTPATAGQLAPLAVGTIYAVQILLSSLGILDLAASMIADAAVIAGVVGFARRRGVGLADLGVRRVPARFILAAVMIGLAMWYLTAWLVVVIDPPGDPAKLQQLIESTPLAPTLVALAIFPAFAEELVFRGVLTRALASRFGAIGAIAISAAAFATYHLFPPQMLSTFVLGFALGFLTLRSRSIVPSVIVHLLNNTVAIMLPRNELPAVGTWIDTSPATMFVVSIVLVGGGLALAAKGVV